MGNSREERKRARIEMLKNMLTEGPVKTEDLVNTMIFNFAITRRTALEEINAVRFFVDGEVKNDKEKFKKT